MSDNTRDTQFAGFAKLLLDKLGDGGFVFEGADDPDREEQLTRIQTLLARRAYDLVGHTVGYSLEYLRECGIGLSGSMNSRITPSIPDMTELPSEVTQDKKITGLHPRMKLELIAYLEQKGFDVYVRMFDSVERIEAVASNGVRFRMDTILFRGLDRKGIFNLVDQQLMLLRMVW